MRTLFISVKGIESLKLFNEETINYLPSGQSYIFRYRLAFAEGDFRTIQWKSTGYIYAGNFESNLDYNLWNYLRLFYYTLHQTYITNELDFNPHIRIIEVSLDYCVVTIGRFKLTKYLNNLNKERELILKDLNKIDSQDLPVNKIISASLKDTRLTSPSPSYYDPNLISREEQLLHIINELNAELTSLRNQNKDK